MVRGCAGSTACPLPALTTQLHTDWHNDTVLLPWEVTQQMSDALNATGAPIWLLAHCVGYDLLETSWCAEFMNSYTVWTDHHDNWATTQSIFFFLAVRARARWWWWRRARARLLVASSQWTPRLSSSAAVAHAVFELAGVRGGAARCGSPLTPASAPRLHSGTPSTLGP